MQLGDWHATVAPGDAPLVTEEGLSAGMTVGELRATVPWVEFTYNEGLLDSFSIPSWTGGGYWGRLDWDPTTIELDYVGIEAIQAALNEHDANLVVDGEWGPNTEAAWLAFLTDRDVEPVTSQLWLTPVVGEALGLPPDDITVATLEPRPAGLLPRPGHMDHLPQQTNVFLRDGRGPREVVVFAVGTLHAVEKIELCQLVAFRFGPGRLGRSVAPELERSEPGKHLGQAEFLSLRTDPRFHFADKIGIADLRIRE